MEQSVNYTTNLLVEVMKVMHSHAKSFGFNCEVISEVD